MEQKFQRGFRVLILSMLSTGGGENAFVGDEAIIEYSNKEHPLEEAMGCVDGLIYYSLLILLPGGTCGMRWYDENFLELICCNEVKGKKILMEDDIQRAQRGLTGNPPVLN